MTTAEQIAHTVQAYVELAGKGDAEGLVALYADSATVEDPVGGEVRRGRDAIHAFYHSVIEGSHYDTELVSLHVASPEAAFLFRVTVDGKTRIDVIEVMTFDDDGAITSMKAYWGPQNITKV
jgi:steroid delta-isomerase